MYTPSQQLAVANCTPATTCHVCARERQKQAAIAAATVYTTRTGQPTAVYWERVPYDDAEPGWTWATWRDLNRLPLSLEVADSDICWTSDELD